MIIFNFVHIIKIYIFFIDLNIFNNNACKLFSLKISLTIYTIIKIQYMLII